MEILVTKIPDDAFVFVFLRFTLMARARARRVERLDWLDAVEVTRSRSWSAFACAEGRYGESAICCFYCYLRSEVRESGEGEGEGIGFEGRGSPARAGVCGGLFGLDCTR
jgi:hypothetical protein